MKFRRMVRAAVVATLFCLPMGIQATHAAGLDGLKISVSADLVAGVAFGENSSATDRFDLREAEIFFYAPTDYLFDAVLSAAAHSESGVYNFEVHEAFLKSSKLVNRVRFRLGQYFLGIGRLNRFHRHDWPFTLTPKVHSTFFDSSGEGVVDTGIEVSWLLPTSKYIEWTIGITNGWKIGHAHSVGLKPSVPTHYMRLATYFDLPGEGGLEMGLNYLGRRAQDFEWTSIAGLDLTAKWRVAKVLKFLYQSEVWYRRQKFPSDVPSENIGTYQFVRYGFDERWGVGLRWDYFVNLSNFLNGSYISNSVTALAPQIEYKNSEFVTFRLGAQFEWDKSSDRQPLLGHQVFFQTVFLLGAHPSHEF